MVSHGRFGRVYEHVGRANPLSRRPPDRPPKLPASAVMA
jgi:hypothetical protein